MRSEKTSSFTVAPVVGAAGAAVAISMAAERLSANRQTIALGGAAVAFAFSQATSGAARAFFQGAAIASIGVAIAEMVRTLRNGAPVAAARPPAAAPVAGPEKTEVQPSPPATEEDESTGEAVPSEAVDQLSTVYGHLTERERRMLWLINATGSIAQITALRNQLLRRPPPEAVAFLRHSVLSSEVPS